MVYLQEQKVHHHQLNPLKKHHKMKKYFFQAQFAKPKSTKDERIAVTAILAPLLSLTQTVHR